MTPPTAINFDRQKMATKPVVFVIGASGLIGSATVQALAAKYTEQVEIRAGVRNPDKAVRLKGISGITVVQATMGDREGLKDALKGVDNLFIVTPGADDCDQLAIATAEVAKDVGVKFIMIVSLHIAMVENMTNTVLGAPFAALEEAIKKLGVPFAILRLPDFMDNLWQHKRTIVGQGVIHAARNLETPYGSISVEDAGKAAATILIDPSKHAGKTYCLVSDCFSYDDIVKMFSEALRKEIKYNQLSIEDLKKRLTAAQLPQRITDGLLEFAKLSVGSNVSATLQEKEAVTPDYEMITGEKPTTVKAWIEKNAPGFQ